MKPAYHLIFLLILLSICFASQVQAQIIKGKITRHREPLYGLSIQKKKQAYKSISDIYGNFVIKAKVGDQLLIRQQDTTWNVIATQDMLIELTTLEGQLKKKRNKKNTPSGLSNNWGDTLGAVTRLDHTAFNQGNIFDLYSFIQGRVPGLAASHPGGDPLAQYDVQIRGLHTFSDLNYNQIPFDNITIDPRELVIDRSRPLLVIDGLPSASLLSVDPANIASIKVLRDAASAAAYGLRAANGVIEIKTKLEENKPLSVTYHTYLAQDSPVNLPEVLPADEYRRRINTPNTNYYRPQNDQGSHTDWQQEITRSAWSHAHLLGIGGTLNHTKYRLSFNYRDQQGIAKQSGFDQWNAQLRLRQQLWKDRLRLGLNAGHTKRSFQEIDPLVFRQSSIYNPTAPVYSDTSGRYGGYYQAPFFFYNNPVAMQAQTTREGRNEVSTLGGNFRMAPLKGLVIMGRYTFQRSNDLYGLLYPRDAYYGGANLGGRAGRDKRLLENQYSELGVSYQLKWDRHRLQFDGAYAYQQWDFTLDRIDAYGFNNDDFTYENMVGAERQFEDQSRTRDKQIAFFGSLAYEWNNILFLQANLRREGASRMGPENKWAWFPALQGAFSLHNLLNWENRFHFRIGYGETGQLPPKNFAAHWKVSQYDYLYYRGEYVPSYDFINTPNPAIGEERRSEWNIGLDLGIIRNRLMVSINWYDSQSRGIVSSTELPSPPYPQRLFYDNFGALQNRGLELNLSTKVVDHKQFDWNTNLQVFTNTTRLIDMNHPDAERTFANWHVGRLGSPGLCCTQLQQLEQDKSIGTFYGPIYQGIDQEGEWIFADYNHNGSHDPQDNRKIGNAQPDLQFGWHNDLESGRFQLSFLLRGALGQKMINTHRIFYENPGQLGPYNVLSRTFEEPITQLRDYPQWSDYYLEDASFLHLEYITLGYNFQFRPEATISGLRIYLTVQHLFTISGYSGPDPSLRLENLGDPLVPGIGVPNGFNGRGLYFPNRSLMMGLKLQL